jgi:hypothetical protein
MRRVALLLLPLVAVMAACGSDDDAGSVASSPPASSAAPTLRTVPGGVSLGTSAPGASTPAPPPGTGGSPEQRAVADLAARRHVEPAQITTVSVDEVTWRDGSIGCPQPGTSYTQALVPGVRVVLELDGTRYEYHAGGSRPISLCANPQAPLDG